MEDIFLRYCAFGAGQRGDNMMDNFRFGKFCRESRILGPGCNKRDADIIFVRVASAAKRRKITYPEFIHVLERIALKKRVPFTLLEATILQSGGPRLHAAATIPQEVKFHDDKSTYTGVYVHGGPSHNDLYDFVTDAALAPRACGYDERAHEATLKQRETLPFNSGWDSTRSSGPASVPGPVVSVCACSKHSPAYNEPTLTLCMWNPHQCRPTIHSTFQEPPVKPTAVYTLRTDPVSVQRHPSSDNRAPEKITQCHLRYHSDVDRSQQIRSIANHPILFCTKLTMTTRESNPLGSARHSGISSLVPLPRNTTC